MCNDVKHIQIQAYVWTTYIFYVKYMLYNKDKIKTSKIWSKPQQQTAIYYRLTLWSSPLKTSLPTGFHEFSTGILWLNSRGFLKLHVTGIFYLL